MTTVGVKGLTDLSVSAVLKHGTETTDKDDVNSPRTYDTESEGLTTEQLHDQDTGDQTHSQGSTRHTYRQTYIDAYCPGHIIINWSPSRHNLCHFTANHLTDTDKQNTTGKYTN